MHVDGGVDQWSSYPSRQHVRKPAAQVDRLSLALTSLISTTHNSQARCILLLHLCGPKWTDQGSSKGIYKGIDTAGIETC